MLEPEPRDMLGPLYMEMEVASRDQGQFFTPPEISEMMARIQGVDKLLGDGRPFITLSEPACGAGGMVLAVVKTLIGSGYDPARTCRTACGPTRQPNAAQFRSLSRVPSRPTRSHPVDQRSHPVHVWIAPTPCLQRRGAFLLSPL
jgi:hypothetical protein